MRKYLDTAGFKFNPYDSCVTKNIIEGDPLTSVFHVDDVKSRHKDKQVVYNFKQQIEFMYQDSNIGKVKLLRGKFYEYFPMTLYYTTKEEIIFDMRKYVKNMIDEFLTKNEKSQRV